MEPSTAPPAPSTWRRTVRRRSLCGAGPGSPDPVALGRRRAEELEEVVWRLQAEKEAAERAAAALRAELDAERGAAETAASETMLMIARLQREKAAAMMEARELRGLAEGRAGRDRDLQDRLAAVSALAASYAALLRAHGVDPGYDEEDEEEDGHSVEYLEAEADVDSHHGGHSEDAKGTVPEEPYSPLRAENEKGLEYTADVQCVRCAATKKTVAATALALGEEDGLSLCKRVEALEADSAAMRREVTALRAEWAHVALAREVARRLCLRAAAAESAIVVAAERPRPRFSLLAICKWVLSTIKWGKTHSASAVSSSSSFGSSATSVLGQLVLLERYKGVRRIQSSWSPASHNQMPEDGETALMACCQRQWSF